MCSLSLRCLLAANYHSLKFEQTSSTRSHDNSPSSSTSTVLQGLASAKNSRTCYISRVEKDRDIAFRERYTAANLGFFSNMGRRTSSPSLSALPANVFPSPHDDTTYLYNFMHDPISLSASQKTQVNEPMQTPWHSHPTI